MHVIKNCALDISKFSKWQGELAFLVCTINHNKWHTICCVECLSLFVGEHDLFAFSTGDCQKGTTCTVKSVEVAFDHRRNAYCVTIAGKRFLHHMVRRMVGAALKSVV